MPGEADARVQPALPRARSLLPCHTPARWRPPRTSAHPVPHTARPAGQSEVPRVTWQSCCGHPAGPGAAPPCAAPTPPVQLTAGNGHGAVSPSAPTATASMSAPGVGAL